MRSWSESSNFGHVNFVCVCVDGRAAEISRLFQREYFGSSRVLNAMIRSDEDFPRFPTQLGCQGFVVVDASGRFATLRSPSLNKVGAKAFDYVENVLAQLRGDDDGDPGPVDDGRELKFSSWQRSEPPSAPAPAPSPAILAYTGRPPAPAPAPSEAAPTETKAVFAEHACRDDPQPLESSHCPPCYELGTVGHGKMDDDHAQLERLMQAAVSSGLAADVEALVAFFARHAEEEEELMRESGFGRGGGAGGMFSAVDSHAADHAAIFEAGSEVSATADEDGRVEEARVRSLCRRIVEHAVNYDAKYAGHLTPKRKRAVEA
mmetsp:Transcript_4454/g.15631  ORF Transcript_4454/g.15631 Transcript_4454/m.15631 type:complete len:319 (+) Transcript_4454:292-1248(+)